MRLNTWQNRAQAEAHHFNPAYCGALTCEFVHAYESAKNSPVPFALIFCALPIALHPATRDRLPKSIVTGLFPWLENNPDVRVGFADRARNLTPYVREALHYAIARQAICFGTGGVITIGPNRASFTPKTLEGVTMEVRETVNATRKVARWFAAAGDPTTVLAAWGISV